MIVFCNVDTEKSVIYFICQEFRWAHWTHNKFVYTLYIYTQYDARKKKPDTKYNLI